MKHYAPMDSSTTPISEYITLGIFFISLMFTIFLNAIWGGIIAIIAGLVGFINFKRKKTALAKVAMILSLAMLGVCILIILIAGIKTIAS